MNDLERQLATLFKACPGEPPMTLSPDALSAAAAPRRRYLAAMIAAAVVLAIAVPIALVAGRGSSPTSSSGPSSGPIDGVPTDPRHMALRAAESIIAAAPAPPGARKLDPPRPTALKQPASMPGAQHVQRTRFWTAPGSVPATIAYLGSHLPTGMRSDGSGSAGGPNGPTAMFLDFSDEQFNSLQYTVVAYHGGVAIRADAQVLWAPLRDRADTVPASVTSVTVVVVRKNPQVHQGAPTVRRTLNGTAARHLADVVNRLPRPVPGPYHCPVDLGGEHRTDQLVFHTPGQSATTIVNLAGCVTTTFQVGDRPAIQLSQSYVGASSDIDHVILKAVGLPANYGT